MAKRFVGREPFFKGKTLFELCCNLRNFGEGRVVYRQCRKEFPEPSYYRLTKVEPDMSDSTRQGGTAWGDKVYRGRKFGVIRIDAGYKVDWILVPKEEEAAFCKITSVLPQKEKPPTHMPCPPLLELLIRGEMETNGKTPPSNMFNLELKVNKQRETIG